MRKDTVESFISKAIAIHGNKYDYSKVVYKNSRTKVEIACRIHGPFWQTPNVHLSKHSCPKCGKESSSKKTAHSDESFIVRAICVHEYKFNYQFVDYKNNLTKIKIKCNDCGTIFYQKPKQHLLGTNCRICYLNKAVGANIYSWKGGVVKKNIPLYETYAPQLEKYQPVHKIEQDGIELLGVECAFCKKIFVPKLTHVQNRINSINGKSLGEHNLYCTEECKVACPIYKQVLWPKDYKSYENTRSNQKDWAVMVKERDNYTCRNCGTTEGQMIAHHVDPVINNPVESADIDNGKTLCEACDKIAHQAPGCSYAELRCSSDKEE